MFYVVYKTLGLLLLIMFCVLKFYFVDIYGVFTSSPTWRLTRASENACALQSREKHYFSKQNITSMGKLGNGEYLSLEASK